MRASGSKPPGTLAFNIQPTHDQNPPDVDVEVLNSLPIGAMAFSNEDPLRFHPSSKWMEFTAPLLFGPLYEWRKQYPLWKDPGVWARHQIGDCYALVADLIITLSQPYPGDERLDITDLRPKL